MLTLLLSWCRHTIVAPTLLHVPSPTPPIDPGPTGPVPPAGPEIAPPGIGDPPPFENPVPLREPPEPPQPAVVRRRFRFGLRMATTRQPPVH